MNKRKILILESDQLSQSLFKTFFIDDDIRITGSSIKAFEILKNFHPHLILINASLGGLNGYDTCELMLKTPENKNIPIVFLSDDPSLDEKKRVYGLGAFTYISKPYDIFEFKNIIDQAIKTNNELTGLESNLSFMQDNLDLSYATFNAMQHNLSLMQYISEFLQNALFCHDYSSLTKLLFSTINKFGSSGILLIKTNKEPLIQSETEHIHSIEKEIIQTEMKEKITVFGKNRAIFSWPSARLLVRNIKDNSDYYTFLMNGLEASIQAINTNNELLDAVDNLHGQNYSNEENATQLFQSMNDELKEIFLSLGYSTLTPEEEEKLNSCVDSYSNQIVQILSSISDNNSEIKNKINKLKESKIIQPESRDDDEVLLF